MGITACFPGDTDAARTLREQMVMDQLERRGVRDARVLEAFRRLPRHLFCSEGTPIDSAYADRPLGIGCGQTISQPLMVAEMTVQLRLKDTDRVLEIGTGSGYQAAVLALLVAEVHTVERIGCLAEQAQARFRQLGFDHVHVHVGDGTCGWPDAAPYDAIVVTAAAPDLPEPLRQQLADGGRLAIPVGPRHVQDLVVWERQGNAFNRHEWGGCRFVPLIGRHGWPD
ncbi:MAG: protein-L-isoaspartate O-methyltransferase [Lentisphaerae bacterium RIFOXYB12_FULL_65_16]|nr:MAG: protein-L-isoaspartate O-methyltransferase [Lentisphaerae bacterium RIFOXYA12_64_32]OGV85349.1 MAG: protein-L-isoaspartate O-methyltransferase [Lentisphaerae bacterium RIFOXYB12_FULL_65_16]